MILYALVITKAARMRDESRGAHFKREFPNRDDEHFMYVAAWEYQGHGQPETMEKEPLVYEHIQIANRNYK